MENFTIRLAGQYFTIGPVCDYIREYCKDYIVADVTGQSGIADGDSECTSSGVGDITTERVTRIRITQSDIDCERE